MGVRRDSPIIMKHPRGVHSTPKELKKAIEALEKVEGFDRIIIGPSKGTHHAFIPGDIKYTCDMRGGVKASGYTSRGVMDLFVYCKQPEEMKKVLLKSKDKKK